MALLWSQTGEPGWMSFWKACSLHGMNRWAGEGLQYFDHNKAVLDGTGWLKWSFLLSLEKRVRTWSLLFPRCFQVSMGRSTLLYSSGVWLLWCVFRSMLLLQHKCHTYSTSLIRFSALVKYWISSDSSWISWLLPLLAINCDYTNFMQDKSGTLEYEEFKALIASSPVSHMYEERQVCSSSTFNFRRMLPNPT